ncbi:hypothetical protein [Sulfitobacter aestuariivivens]|uniref:Glycerophosphoryl diester phosphodiesterase membrane domain-containing protein n=1 Tax=Sulfitobacter aestuariivivens TaxID=2766981 RepID=A0A927HFS8_9RHOB|nr:hypothetical protein [Sulfitobacter aestuariivivens]MBD3665246.1 hypothetical protein [Sulfitobacter aestuariivivens]
MNERGLAPFAKPRKVDAARTLCNMAHCISVVERDAGMKGWEIFMHSVRLVFSNLDAALRISLVPYAISGLALVYLGSEALQLMEGVSPEDMMAAGPGVWTGFMLYGLISIIVALWIAVSWHRYVLLEEYPTGWIPRFHGGAIFQYLFKGVIIAFVVLGMVIVVTIILGLLIGWTGPLGSALVSVAGFAAATYAFYRLCPLLPAAAMGRNMVSREAWQATSGNDATIAMLVFLVLVSSFVLQIPISIFGAESVLGIAYSVIVGWIMMLVGVSVLTTFYGHFVEGRPID